MSALAEINEAVTNELVRVREDHAALRAICDYAVAEAEGREATEAELVVLIEALRHEIRPLLDAVNSARKECRNGMFALDSVGVTFLRKMEDNSKAESHNLAEDLCTRRRKAWSNQTCVHKLWDDRDDEVTRVPFLRLVAIALWSDRVRKAASIPVSLARASVAGHLSRGRVLNDDHQVLDRNGRLVARIEQPTGAPLVSLSLVRSFLPASAKLIAHRLFRWIPRKSWEQKVIFGSQAEARVIQVVGGFAALAKQLGVKSNKAPEQIRMVLDVFRYTTVETEKGSFHGLLVWEELRRPTDEDRLIQVVPGSLLLPTGGRGKLVPVPHDLPPFVGRERDWAAQASLQLLVIAELRKHAISLVETGGVRIDRHAWRQLFDRAGVPWKLFDQLFDAWVHSERRPKLIGGRNGVPRFLSSVVGDELWTLAPPYAGELSVLKEGGEHDQNQSRRGKRGAASRARKGKNGEGTRA